MALIQHVIAKRPFGMTIKIEMFPVFKVFFQIAKARDTRKGAVDAALFVFHVFLRRFQKNNILP